MSYLRAAPEAFTPAFSGPVPSIQDVAAGIDQTAAADTNALFAGLLALEWKSIGIPYQRIRTRIRQDLVIHKFVDRDGAHVEGTGRHPLEITARVPCLNGLDRGVNETWQRPLYPFVRDNLIRACLDKSSGVLQHPELGPLTCKVETMEWELEAQVRSGVWVDFSWVESDDDGVALEQDLANPSPLANAEAAANDLDQQLAELDPRLFPQPYVPPTTFSDLMRSIKATVDTETLLQKQAAGRIDNLIYQATSLEDSLSRASNALNWPMVASCERAKEAGYDLRRTLLNKGRKVALFTLPKASTMAQAAAIIGASLADVLQLNTGYVGAAVIPAGAQIRYYKQAA